MDVEVDVRDLPRFELVKSVVVAPPRQPNHEVPSDEAGVTSDDDHDNESQLEYVTNLERSCDNGQVAAALSSRDIKLYSRDTMLLTGQLSGHTGPLTQLAFAPSDSHGLFSASEDGTVRSWDTRSLATSMTFGQSGEEVWSMAVSGVLRLSMFAVECCFVLLRYATKFLD